MPKYILSIDQGTTSTRCMLFDHAGAVVASAQKEHRQIYPQPGWVEHDAEEIWENAKAVVAAALRQANAGRKDIAAIGITNQRETTVVWDRKTGKPIHAAIVWQDTRTDSICRELAGSFGEDRLREKTGLPSATYFSGPKLKWLLDSKVDLRKRAEASEVLFGNIDSWLIWKLTGEHFTDVTNASRTMLMNLHSLDWDDELIEALEIPKTMLPRIGASSEPIAAVLEESSLGGVPLTGDLGDQQAALFGQACYVGGEAKNTYGTGCFMLMNTGGVPVMSKAGLLTTVAYKIGAAAPVYALEGSVAVAGALVQWIRDNLGLIDNSADIERLARSVDDNGGIFFVPAFAGLFAPYWRSDARGAILGMTRYANKGHIARAALEATAFQTLDVLEAMEQDSGIKLSAVKVDGGMVANELLMQFQADVLNVPVTRPIVTETTALGAAYAAGLAVGYWKSLDELRGNWRPDKTWYPAGKTAKRDEQYALWKKAVSRTLNWVE